MIDTNRWLLPAGIEEVLPTDAHRIENLRRKILDLFTRWGYSLVIPPLVEYVESLLLIDDEDLNLQTLKLIDQGNGRMMGLHADMTPQVARIDAHRLTTDGINRLCYAGTVLRAKSEALSGARALMQFGAEIYGCAGCNSDIETIRLMSATMKLAGIADMYIDIGHAGIYKELVRVAQLSQQQAETLSDLIQLKAAHEVRAYLREQKIDEKYKPWFVNLSSLHGDINIIKEARQIFKEADVEQPIAIVEKIINGLDEFGITAQCDFGEFGGYHYETGATYSVFIQGQGQAVACGGRYDNIGQVFGRARPATGFSSDLRLLVCELAGSNADNNDLSGIFAPINNDVKLRQKVIDLRVQGERVIEQLEQDTQAGDFGCDRELILENSEWKVVQRRK